MGIFVFIKNRKRAQYVIYVLFCFSIAVWSFFYYAWQIADNADTALFCTRGLMAGAIFIPIFYLHHILALLGQHRKQRKLVRSGYIFGCIFLLSDFTPFFITGVSPKLIFPFWPNPGTLYHIFLPIWASYVIIGVWVIIKQYSQAAGFTKNQLKYVLVATAVGWLGGATNYPLWYNIPILPVGNILVSLYIAIVTYAIAKYQLLDIRIALTRSSIFVFIYGLVFSLSFLITSLIRPALYEAFEDSWWVGPAGIFLLLAALAPYISIYLTRKAEGRILQEERRYRRILLSASRGMLRIRDLNRLLNLIVHILTKTVRISQATVYLIDKEKNVFLPRYWRGKDTPVEKLKISGEDPLIGFLQQHKEIIGYEEIQFGLESERLAHKKDVYEKSALLRIENMMQRLKAALIAPNFIENKIIGFVVLGQKLNGRFYSQDDTDVFAILANEMSLAIENALFYEEVRQTQARLFQSEKLATMGQLATGIAHEIHNPLTVISGEAQLLLNRLNRDVSPETSKEELFSDRKKAMNTFSTIIKEVGRTSDITRRILKHSRPAKGSYEALDVNQAIEEAFALIAHQIVLSDICVTKELDRNVPMIKGSMNQLQEVFINILLNAAQELEDRKGSLTISSRLRDDIVEIIFTDNGPGTPPEAIKRIFDPVFVAGINGSGLGLFVSYRIIKEHGGAIDIQSRSGEGTSFIVRLPVLQTEKENMTSPY
ncbi:MAG: GAF domain-containing protein [Candidatus Omnitrophica bacterium]|nr:GAF domain-containing protein [Candidatus Omnitrophota bacterium]